MHNYQLAFTITLEQIFLLQSNDGNRVTAIARWESQENVAALRDNQEFKDLHNQEFNQVIESVEPRFYTTVIKVQRSSE